ncbi:MAG TPA: universal stress protein [Phycisphaerae bacterium]|jgi:nucleotide-binding universal stress UspA family protein
MAIKIAKILYPTDFSELSLLALSYAREFASIFDAQLYCVHVVDEAGQYWTALGPESTPIGPAVEDLMSMAEGQMKRFADEHLLGLKFPPVTAVVMGRPFAEIISYARENTIDLIVIATHGRGGLSHVLLGSTAEKLVRKSPCPVLTVRHPQHTFVMP